MVYSLWLKKFNFEDVVTLRHPDEASVTFMKDNWLVLFGNEYYDYISKQSYQLKP